MLQRIKAFVRDSKAVSALEYALLLGIIATAVTTAIIALSDSVTDGMTAMGNEVTEAIGEVDD